MKVMNVTDFIDLKAVFVVIVITKKMGKTFCYLCYLLDNSVNETLVVKIISNV